MCLSSISLRYTASCRHGAEDTFTYTIPFSTRSQVLTSANLLSAIIGHLLRISYSLQKLKYPFSERTSLRRESIRWGSIFLDFINHKEITYVKIVFVKKAINVFFLR